MFRINVRFEYNAAPSGPSARGLLALVAALLLVGAAAAPVSAAEQLEEPVILQEAEPEADEYLDAVDVEEELLVSSTDKESTTPTETTGEPTALRTGPSAAQLGPTAESLSSSPVVQLLRIAAPAYHDGISALAGQSRPSPREISNSVMAQSGSSATPSRASDLIWQWGQFVDHDIDLTEPDEDNPEHEDIPVPLGDPFFDPLGEGGKVIPFTRSVYDPATGTDLSNPRQQINSITSVIDASNVYGSDDNRAQALRTNDGTGRLRTSSGNFLPYNDLGLANAGGAKRTDLFLAGDVRANEQVALSAMHTLWMREHNFWADRFRQTRRGLTGDEIYEAARETVAFEMQIITYRDFLPILLGPDPLPPYPGYDPNIDPTIANVFSTAAYRLGHTMLSATILRQDADGQTVPEGNLPLRDAFFDPTRLTETGVAAFMKGLASQIMQRIDVKLVDDVRNFLFGPPGSGGLDLASLNIQRGRDHGLPDYNTFRIAYGLTPAADFSDITSDAVLQEQLAATYGNVNDVDVWVGALAEDHVSGALVGELLYAAMVDQFERLRDGDPDWYQNRLSFGSATALERQTLRKVIARNSTLVRGDLQVNVFVVP